MNCFTSPSLARIDDLGAFFMHKPFKPFGENESGREKPSRSLMHARSQRDLKSHRDKTIAFASSMVVQPTNQDCRSGSLSRFLFMAQSQERTDEDIRVPPRTKERKRHLPIVKKKEAKKIYSIFTCHPIVFNRS